VAKRRKEEHQEEEHENSERWMLTYADLITLLLALFILLYSMSKVDEKKYQEFAAAAAKAFGTTTGQDIISKGQGPGVIENNFETTQNTQNANESIIKQNGEKEIDKKLKEKIEKYIADNKLTDKITVSQESRGLVIRLRSSYLFKSGQADISLEVRKNIDKIGAELKTLNNYIRIEGHTDNDPIKNSKFADNWDLAYARANNVRKILMEDLKFPAWRLSPSPHADSRPIVKNNSAYNKSLNRRVEIVVVNTELSESESVK
jgi:chemotaxis protein MotB